MGKIRLLLGSVVKKGSVYFYVGPAILYLIISCFVPLIDALRRSFFSSEGASSVFVGLTNYKEVIKDALFLKALGNSIYFTFLSVVFHILIGLVLAIFLSKKEIKGRNVFRSLQIIPWLFPSVVASVIWILLYQNEFGLINSVLLKLNLGFLVHSWLGEPKLVLTSVTIVNIWQGYAFAALMFLAAIQNVPQGIYEAADIDGAGEWAKIWKITIPIIKPVIFTVILLDTIWTFRFFDMVWVMTKGGPRNSSEILPTLVYKTAFYNFDFNKAAAVGGIMVLIMLVPIFLYLRVYRASE